MRFPPAVLIISTLAGCGPSPEERYEAESRRAGAVLAAQDSAERAAFQRLPACPMPAPYPVSRGDHVQRDGFPIPASFQQDTGSITYMHGGHRYEHGDTTVEVIFGHWGWSTFTGLYGGGGVVPGGCRATIGQHNYLVMERHKNERFDAEAILLDEKSTRVYGQTLYGVEAPHPTRAFLLQLLAARDTTASPTAQR